MKKYLIIRFSSIGDIVLTSPIIRCLKEQQPDAIVHFITKEGYLQLLKSSPYIDKIYTIKKDVDEVFSVLQKERYDFVIDLHRNLRSLILKRKLKVPSASFPKLNIEKFFLTTFKINRLPDIHIVDRYFEAVKPLGIKNDGKGLDYFIPDEDQIKLNHYSIQSPFIAFAIGAQFATKRLPIDKILEIIEAIDLPVVLLGGPTDELHAKEIVSRASKEVINLCGSLSLNQSASVVQQAAKVITHDTGLMHIAAAFNKIIISIWGNTVPELGMYPYLPHSPEKFSIHQVDVKCRPCSKIGYESCPKKHFNCMNMQNTYEIVEKANQR